MSTRKKYKTRQYDELLAFLQTIPGRHVTVSELHDHFAGGDASIGTTTIYRHLEPGGTCISSGILLEKEEMVATAIRKAGFDLCEIRRKGEWCCIAARKPEGAQA